MDIEEEKRTIFKALREAGKNPAAVGPLRKRIQDLHAADPGNLTWAICFARVLKIDGEAELALEILRQLWEDRPDIKRHPEHAHRYVMEMPDGRLHSYTGLNPEYGVVIRELLVTKNPDATEIAHLEASRIILAEVDPREATSHTMIGRDYMKRQKPAAALPHFQEAIVGKNPEGSRLEDLIGCALALNRIHLIEDIALHREEELLAYLGALNKAVMHLYLFGKRDTAQKLLRSALKKYPTAEALWIKGTRIFARTDRDFAAECAEKALALNPHLHHTVTGLGFYYLTTGKSSQLIKLMSKTTPDTTLSAGYLTLRAAQLCRAIDKDQSLRLYRIAEEKLSIAQNYNRHDPRVTLNICRAKAALEKLDEAILIAKSFYNGNPGDTRRLNLYAFVCLLCDRPSMAEELIKNHLRTYPGASNARTDRIVKYTAAMKSKPTANLALDQDISHPERIEELIDIETGKGWAQSKIVEFFEKNIKAEGIDRVAARVARRPRTRARA